MTQDEVMLKIAINFDKYVKRVSKVIVEYYIADFVVYINDTIYVVEVKPAKYVHNEYVIAKASGAYNLICNSSRFDTYIFIVEKDLLSLSAFESKFHCQKSNCKQTIDV